MSSVGIKIVPPHAEFITPKYWPEWAENGPKLIEECGRVSHKSENRITDDSAEPFIRKIALKYGHESIIEHINFTACLVGSRSMSHQLVRHRIAAFTQESQRYCDYSSDGDETKLLSVIMPLSIIRSNALWGHTLVRDGDYLLVDGKTILKAWLDEREIDPLFVELWCRDKLRAYESYLYWTAQGIPPEDARYDLPNACKTEVYTTFNLREWRHVLGVRTEKHAQWEIRLIMCQVHDFLTEHVPFLFKDIQPHTEDFELYLSDPFEEDVDALEVEDPDGSTSLRA